MHKTVGRVCGVLLSCLLLAGGLTGSAQADERAAGRDPWAGVYVGGHFAYTILDQVNTRDGNIYPTLSLEQGGGGVFAGLNHRFGARFVAGIEGDFSWANLDAKQGRHTWGSDWFGTIRGRLGYLLTPGTLVYVTAGAAYGDFDYVGGPPVPPPAPPPATPPQERKSETLWGSVAGVGVEQTMSPWRLRLEYLFADFEDWNFTAHDEAYSVEAETHVFRIGAVIPFGG